MEKYCRFVDTDYQIKFFIKDGGSISINGKIHEVTYVDDYYIAIDGQEIHIYEFAHDNKNAEVKPISGAMQSKHDWELDKHYNIAYVSQWREIVIVAPYTCNKIDIPGFYAYEYGHIEEQPDLLVKRERLHSDIVGTIFTNKKLDKGRACYLQKNICLLDRTMTLNDFIDEVGPINLFKTYQE